MNDKTREFRKRPLGEPIKEINPENADSQCPACRCCTRKHTLCGWRECPRYMEWLHDTWEAIQMKWSRDL